MKDVNSTLMMDVKSVNILISWNVPRFVLFQIVFKLLIYNASNANQGSMSIQEFVNQMILIVYHIYKMDYVVHVLKGMLFLMENAI